MGYEQSNSSGTPAEQAWVERRRMGIARKINENLENLQNDTYTADELTVAAAFGDKIFDVITTYGNDAEQFLEKSEEVEAWRRIYWAHVDQGELLDTLTRLSDAHTALKDWDAVTKEEADGFDRDTAVTRAVEAQYDEMPSHVKLSKAFRQLYHGSSE